MSVPSLDLIVNIADPGQAGLLTLVDGQVSAGSAQIPRLVRNDGEQLRIRAVQPSTSGVRQFDDVDLSTATVRLAIGSPDKVPTAGTFYLKTGAPLTSGSLVTGKRYLIATYVAGDAFTNVGAASNATGIIFIATGTTPTTWTNASSLQEITADLSFDAAETDVATALNATAAIAAAGNVTVTKSSAGIYLVAFVTVGAKTLLGSAAGNLAPLSIISISRVQTGTSSINEFQLVRLIQNPYCFATPSTALPVAAAAVTNLQTGTTGTGALPSIQSITLNPAPYAGAFSFVIGGVTKVAAYNLSASDMQTLVGSGYVVTKVAANSWTFQWVATGPQTAITVNVAGLSVPIGVTGSLSLATLGLFQAFAATTDSSLTLTLEIELQFAGEDPRTVLQMPIYISRDVIDQGNLVPASLPYGYLSNTASLDFSSIAANSEATLTITVPGAVAANTPSVSLGWSAALPDGIVIKQTWVSATSTVSIRARNTSGSAIDPAAVTCRATVLQF